MCHYFNNILKKIIIDSNQESFYRLIGHRFGLLQLCDSIRDAVIDKKDVKFDLELGRNRGEY